MVLFQCTRFPMLPTHRGRKTLLFLGLWRSPEGSAAMFMARNELQAIFVKGERWICNRDYLWMVWFSNIDSNGGQGALYGGACQTRWMTWHLGILILEFPVPLSCNLINPPSIVCLWCIRFGALLIFIVRWWSIALTTGDGQRPQFYFQFDWSRHCMVVVSVRIDEYWIHCTSHND